MKLAVAGGGVWLQTDAQNDVHFYADKVHGEIAINDPSVYKGGLCPLALGFDGNKATLQVVEPGKEYKSYDIPLEVVNDRLRKFLADLKAEFAK